MKNKIDVLVLFIVLVSILITMNVIFHESLRSDLVGIYNRQQELVAIGISKSIETAISREISKLKFLSGNLSDSFPWNKDKIQRIVEDNFGLENDISINVTIVSSNQEVIYSNDSVKDISHCFPKGRKVDNLRVVIFHDINRVYVVTPVYHSNNYIGCILLTIEIKDIAAKFLVQPQNMYNGKEGKVYAWLMDEDGNLLYHPTEATMIYNNFYQAEKDCYQCHSSFDLERKVLEGPASGSGRYIAATQEDKILAFSKINIGEKTWIICVSSPYTEVISVTETSMKLYSGLVFAIFATVFLGGSIIVWMNRKHIRAEKEANEAIHLENKKLDTIVSAIGAGLVLVDNDTHEILWTNKTMSEWAQRDLVGEDCALINPVCVPDEMTGEIREEVLKGLFGKKGNTFQITTAPVRNIEGNFIGELKLVQDVTRTIKLEEQVLRSEKLTALGRLVSGVAHEIGNPLTSISSFVQILKKKAGDDFTKDNLDVIYNNIQRISEIVGKMSKFSKLPELEIREHDINEIIQSKLEIIYFDKKIRTIEIKKELSDSLPAVQVDEGYIVQVLVNLLLNAADAIGDSQGTIIIKSFFENNSVIVQIVDSGDGIEEDVMGKIFDPFFTTKEKGTGLGLPISYEIIKKLGGEITARSHHGEGSAFSVILPVEEK